LDKRKWEGASLLLETEFICYYFWPEEEGEEEAGGNPSRQQEGRGDPNEPANHAMPPDASGERIEPEK